MRLSRISVVVIVVVLAGLAVLIFPAVQAAREAARRMQCGNNVKQLCLGLQNYHDTFLYLPYGARNRSVPPDYDEATWGSSWFVATRPFCEANPDFDRMYKADLADPANDYVSPAVRNVQHGARYKYLTCPSSPLPEMQILSSSSLVVPSYAGLMGATDEPGPDVTQNFKDNRIAAGPYGGRAAGNGMLVINESLTFAACTDGTANMIIVGEISDWYFTDAGAKRNPALSIGDAGHAPSNAAGWLAGNNLGFFESHWGISGEFVRLKGPPIPADRVCNLITVNYPVGINNRLGKNDSAPDWGTQGVGRCGLNNPLLSAHPAGAMVGYLDGHVQLLTKQTAVWVLKRLTIRDDGGVSGCDAF